MTGCGGQIGQRRPASEFAEMTSHGEVAVPIATPKVILSRLPRGESIVTRSSMSVKYVVEGERVYAVDGKLHRVQAGQFLIVNSCAAPLMAQLSRSDGVGLCLYLPDIDYGASCVGEALLDAPVTMAAQGTAFGQLLMSSAKRLLDEPGLGAQIAPAIAATAASQFGSLLRVSEQRFQDLGAVKSSTRRELMRRTELARSYLHSVTERTVTLTELSKEASASPFHLARTFARMYGVSPTVYHRELRLSRIAERLRTEDLSLVEAAADMGFADQASFTKAFKKRYGTPPGEWLRHHCDHPLPDIRRPPANLVPVAASR